MYELTKKENGKLISFEWMPIRQKTFEVIKAKLAITLVVAHPNFDKPFILYTNALGGSVGAVLH